MPKPGTSDLLALRERVSLLRRELMATTDEWYRARKAGKSDEVIQLLRLRSSVVEQLMETQRELLVRLRAEAVNIPESRTSQGRRVMEQPFNSAVSECPRE